MLPSINFKFTRQNIALKQLRIFRLYDDSGISVKPSRALENLPLLTSSHFLFFAEISISENYFWNDLGCKPLYN